MDEDVADEAAGGSERDPPATAGFIGVVVALPGELGAGRAVPRAVADIEEALHGDEGDLAVGCAHEAEVSRARSMCFCGVLRFAARRKWLLVRIAKGERGPAAHTQTSAGPRQTEPIGGPFRIGQSFSD